MSGKLKLIGYGCYPKMPSEAEKIYKPLKAEAQRRLLEKLYGSGRESAGSKYKKKYEESQKALSLAMLKLHESGTSLDELMAMFNIESKKTLQNRLSKARQEV